MSYWETLTRLGALMTKTPGRVHAVMDTMDPEERADFHALLEAINRVEGTHYEGDRNPRGPWMTLYSGQRYHPFAPHVEEIDLESEAHALAALPRFGGHARTFSYCVAHHSVLVSLIAEAFASSMPTLLATAGPVYGLEGVHHDGGEFVCGDLPRPIKHDIALATYREVEHIQHYAIQERWGLGRGKKTDIVAMADDLMLSIELRDLMVGELASWRHASIEKALARLRTIASEKGSGAIYARQALHYVDGVDGLLRTGLHGQIAMDLFITRHLDCVERVSATASVQR